MGNHLVKRSIVQIGHERHNNRAVGNQHYGMRGGTGAGGFCFLFHQAAQGRKQSVQQILIGFAHWRLLISSVFIPCSEFFRILILHLRPGQAFPQTEIDLFQPVSDNTFRIQLFRYDPGGLAGSFQRACKNAFRPDPVGFQLPGQPDSLHPSIFIQIGIRTALNPFLYIPVRFSMSCK